MSSTWHSKIAHHVNIIFFIEVLNVQTTVNKLIYMCFMFGFILYKFNKKCKVFFNLNKNFEHIRNFFATKYLHSFDLL